MMLILRPGSVLFVNTVNRVFILDKKIFSGFTCGGFVWGHGRERMLGGVCANGSRALIRPPVRALHRLMRLGSSLASFSFTEKIPAGNGLW